MPTVQFKVGHGDSHGAKEVNRSWFVHSAQYESDNARDRKAKDSRGVDSAGPAPKGQEVYSTTIKYVQRAVRLQIELNAAQAELDRWKKTQLSPQFSRASPATQVILGRQRLKNTQTVTELREKLDFVITELSELPDLATHSKVLSAEVDQRELMTYIAELKEWNSTLRSLQLSSLNSPDVASSVLEKLDPRKWTWEQIKASVHTLDDLTADIMEKLYTERFTNIDVDSGVTTVFDQMKPKQPTSGADLLDQANSVGDDLGISIDRTAALMEKVSQDTAELAALRAKLDELEKTKAQMKTYLERCEEWQREDAEKIQELTRRLQTLKTLRRKPPPLTLDDMLPAIHRLVVGSDGQGLIEKAVSEAAEQIRNACVRNKEDMLNNIHTSLQPTLDLAVSTCERAGRAKKVIQSRGSHRVS